MVIAAVIVLGIIIAFLIILHHNKHYDIVDSGTFDLNDYQWLLDNFPSDKNVGFINDKETAVEKAIELWRSELGTMDGKPYNPLKQVENIVVAFNSEHKCWLIYGELSINVKGAYPTAIIKQNGDVMTVYWY